MGREYGEWGEGGTGGMDFGGGVSLMGGWVRLKMEGSQLEVASASLGVKGE